MAEQPTEKPKPVAELWKQWRQRYIGPDAPQVQLNHMRLAFFAGAYSVFELMKRITAADLSEADIERMLGRIQDEFEAIRDG